jgi:hypothetical protein
VSKPQKSRNKYISNYFVTFLSAVLKINPIYANAGIGNSHAEQRRAISKFERGAAAVFF